MSCSLDRAAAVAETRYRCVSQPDMIRFRELAQVQKTAYTEIGFIFEQFLVLVCVQMSLRY